MSHLIDESSCYLQIYGVVTCVSLYARRCLTYVIFGSGMNTVYFLEYLLADIGR